MQNDKTLNQSQAFAAMYDFLEKYWERGASEELAMLLGSMSLQPDGKCADPALWNDWVESVQSILERG